MHDINLYAISPFIIYDVYASVKEKMEFAIKTQDNITKKVTAKVCMQKCDGNGRAIEDDRCRKFSFNRNESRRLPAQHFPKRPHLDIKYRTL